MLALTDLIAQYGLASASLLLPGSEMPPPSVAAFLKDVVGIDAAARGAALAAALLRPATLLVALAAYRHVTLELCCLLGLLCACMHPCLHL
jgi:hypothetical protein